MADTTLTVIQGAAEAEVTVAVQPADQLTVQIEQGVRGGTLSSDAITVPDATMPFVGAYYPPTSDDLTDHLNAIDDAFVGAASAIVAVGAASVSNAQKGAPNGVAELDGSGLVLSSQLPSRTITAGTGLTGGGTLTADRTLAIDAATLARIGVTVEATSDSSARTSTTATADGTLQFEAAADTTYRVDAYLIFQGDATADLKLGFTTPTSTMHLTVEGALTTVASASDYDRFLTLTSSGGTTVVGIAGASTPISVRISGVIRCSSAGTVALVWAPNGAGAGTGVTRLARSQLYYRAA